MAHGTSMESIQPMANNDFCRPHRLYFGGKQGLGAVCYDVEGSVEGYGVSVAANPPTHYSHRSGGFGNKTCNGVGT